MGQSLQRLCRDEAGGCTVVAVVSRKVGARVVDGIPQFTASELSAAEADERKIGLLMAGVTREAA